MRFLTAAVLFLLASTPARALEAGETEITIEAEASLLSSYIWRSIEIGGMPVVQGSAGVSVYGLTLWTWFNVETDSDIPGPVNEVDVGLDYGYEYEDFSFGISVQAWFFPIDEGADTTAEVQLSFGWTVPDMPISLVTHHYMDVVTNQGAWFGDYGIELEDETTEWLTVSASWLHAFSNAKFNEFNLETEKGLGAYSMTMNLRLDFALWETGLTVGPQMSLTYLLDASAREALETGITATGGLAIAGEW